MKRTFPILAGALCLCSPVLAQKAGPSMQPAKEPLTGPAKFFAEPAWQRAFAYNLTPLEAVEPKPTPDLVDTMVALEPLVKAEDYVGALRVIKAQVDGNADANPILSFTAGALSQQLGVNAKGAQADEYFRQALRYYEAAIKKAPSYQRAERSLGQLYMQLSGDDQTSSGNVAKAVPHLQNAIKLGAQDSTTFALLGYAYFQQEDYFSAEAALKNALLLDPKSENTRVLLAQTLLLQERYGEARALFEELIKSKPDKTEWWLALVNTYLPNNEVDKAAIVLELVRQMGGGSVQSYELLGNIYITNQTFDLATEVFLSALQKFPDANADVFVNAAQTLVGYSQFDEAARLIDATQAKMKGKLKQEQQLSLLTLESRIAIAKNEGEEAAKVLEQIVAQDADNVGALNTLGSWYGEMVEKQVDGRSVYEPRDLERAVIMLERAEESTDNDGRVRALLTHAQILVRQQDTASLRQAVELLQRAQGISDKPQPFVDRYIQQIQDNLAARTARS